MNHDNSISGKDSSAWLGVLVFVVGLYLACTLIANIASLRIVIFAGFSIDAGTLIYPLTFTLRDLIHKVGGTKTARATIFTGAGVNVLMVVYFGGYQQLLLIWRLVRKQNGQPSLGHNGEL